MHPFVYVFLEGQDSPSVYMYQSCRVFVDKETIFEAYIHGDGQQTRCYTHVDDVSSGIICILESEATGVFNISSEEELSVLELIDILSKVTNKVANVEFVDDRAGQIRKSNISSKRLNSLGWWPRYTIEDGLMSCLSSIE